MSSSDYAIRIKGIGKQYRLGMEQSAGMYRYKSLRDSLTGVIRSPARMLRSVVPKPLNESNSFWALKDVSFDVRRGEVVGIIGRNGAGKSTLLKILSRITRPTTGEIELHGRVGSLLEVGTGFHPELSGRENIFLNGAVLGMTRTEVKRKFDEIVEFSEIRKFIDTPVKQYSSGMYTRLAFAVAAHLEPEILVVDEVLAVGDAEFQKKCLGKMKDVAGAGRTVLFVSHNLAAIQSLCAHSVLLSAGRVVSSGETYRVTESYLRGVNELPDRFLPIQLGRAATLTELVVGMNPDAGSDCATVRVAIKANEDVIVSHCAVIIHSLAGTRVGIIDLRSESHSYRIEAGSRLEIQGAVCGVSLVEGDYSLGIYAVVGDFAGEALQLGTLAVPPQSHNRNFAEYDAVSRGLVRITPTSPLKCSVERSGTPE